MERDYTSSILETLASLEPELYHGNVLWNGRVHFLASMVALTLDAMRAQIEKDEQTRRLIDNVQCYCSFDEAIDGHRCSCPYHRGVVNDDGVCSECG